MRAGLQASVSAVHRWQAASARDIPGKCRRQSAYNPAVSDDQRGLLQPEERERELNRRYLARERVKVIGLLVVLVLILVLAFLRFGRTIPWSAR